MPVLDDFRPILLFFIAIQLIVLVSILFYKRRSEGLQAVVMLSISLISTIASGYVVYLAGIWTDELSMAGDSISFFLLLASGCLCLIHVLAFFLTRRA